MTDNDQLDPAHWRPKVEAYFKAQCIIPRYIAESHAMIPKSDQRILGIRDDTMGTLGEDRSVCVDRATERATISRARRCYAKYYEVLLSVTWNIEVQVTAWLASQVATRKPRYIIDAGCGTGLSTGFIALTFPHIPIIAYDHSGAMVKIARPRIEVCSDSVVLVASHHKYARRSSEGTGNVLLISKCSMHDGAFIVPDFSQSPMPSAAQEEFITMDSMVRAWANTCEGFAKLIGQDGTWIDIGTADKYRTWILEEVAMEVGLENEAWSKSSLSEADGSHHCFEEPVTPPLVAEAIVFSRK